MTVMPLTFEPRVHTQKLYNAPDRTLSRRAKKPEPKSNRQIQYERSTSSSSISSLLQLYSLITEQTSPTMMILEPPIAVRFHVAATATRSSAAAASHNSNRSMWSTEEVNGGVGYVASCRLACSCGFDAPWLRSKKYTSTPLTRRNKLVKNKIRASSEHPGSAQNKNEKASYHPSEDIAASTSENSGDARLTAAETSRTIIEVNSKATLMFSSIISDEFHENIVWPDMPYLTDEHGNIYFQVKNSEDVLQSLTSENNFVQVIVGVDTMEMISEMDLSGPSEIDFGIEEIDDQDADDLDDDDEEDEDEDEDDDEDEDENEDYDSEWVAVLSDDDEQEDSDESLADWAKLETMRFSHPMHFANKLAEVASDDPIDWMEQPPACVAIQGIIRPAFVEDHSTIQNHISAKQSSNIEISKSIENKGENVSAINGHVDNSVSSRDNPGQQLENNRNSDIPFNETSFYRLEMIKIQVFSAQGDPTILELEDYMKAQPDAIAKSAAKIISRLKAGGEKTLQALKSLCWRCKGVQVEEAKLICVDSLGFDLRVCSGTQIQTLRITFKKRATSEYSAERQLNDLLFPRTHPKHQKSKQAHQNEC
ncbi:uncharacterized protein At3g49140 [Lotus japonicus]|uniref:uncharacterized protein At3g49140 n=1 Tax=Lotus japonicus TaxID=34305 RepID=UPI00258712BC|nr:uncharacterized protein At3g49140 [Lotus japonicus]